jgi:hypothetical protein
MVRLSVSTMMYAGLTLSVDTFTGGPLMAIGIVFFVRPSTL